MVMFRSTDASSVHFCDAELAAVIWFASSLKSVNPCVLCDIASSGLWMAHILIIHQRITMLLMCRKRSAKRNHLKGMTMEGDEKHSPELIKNTPQRAHTFAWTRCSPCPPSFILNGLITLRFSWVPWWCHFTKTTQKKTQRIRSLIWSSFSRYASSHGSILAANLNCFLVQQWNSSVSRDWSGSAVNACGMCAVLIGFRT